MSGKPPDGKIGRAATAVVAADGTASYRTVQAAVNAAGATISIGKGTHRGTVTIPSGKTGLTLVGAGFRRREPGRVTVPPTKAEG
ncbi:pectinesterase family protein [Saccharothrix sp. S26]|uniref:pectinesterase family protein n=1 Tax=Saccharothrix sp. S26 TaxID=2907215 RepID=UPI001F1BB91B|nr:pectinesterase family protein [Saccharothrix sp. S26]MCE6996248.1 pectinesterase family protein [Saccharothrix sp. S26]